MVTCPPFVELELASVASNMREGGANCISTEKSDLLAADHTGSHAMLATTCSCENPSSSHARVATAKQTCGFLHTTLIPAEFYISFSCRRPRLATRVDAVIRDVSPFWDAGTPFLVDGVNFIHQQYRKSQPKVQRLLRIPAFFKSCISSFELHLFTTNRED